MRFSFVLLAALVAAFLVPSQAQEPRWKGRGAKVAFVEQEAEHAHHNGQLIGNMRTYGTLSSEAQGRQAVTLNAVGQYVEFTMPIQSNSFSMRYSIPDSEDGKGRNGHMDLLIDGKKFKELPVTSRYGWFYGGYPFNNNPHDVNPHHFYDEVRTLLDKPYPKGTKVRVVVTSLDQSPTFTIDVADFELVPPPIPAPENSVSVVEAGADPTGKVDATKAFQKAVDDGRNLGKTVYIPKGEYLLYDHVIVDNVKITGAGVWYSVLGGRDPNNRQKSGGLFGKYEADGSASKNVHMSHFAIIGDITERDDSAPTNAIGGSFTDSVVEDMWFQHVKCGGWFDGRMTNFTLKNTRILDTTADGVNFHKGVTNSVVENCFLRNTGDDGLAMWAEQYPEVNNKFIKNTVGIPVLANNIAVYGGREIEISDNLVYDTVSNGGGIHVSNRYNNVRGETSVKGGYKIYRNTMLRAGNSDYNWHFGVGAIWFSGLNEDIHADIHVKDCDIIDASYCAIAFIEGKVYGVHFENLNVNGTGTFFLQIQADGDVKFDNVHAVGLGRPEHTFYNCAHQFKVEVGEGAKEPWFSDKPECGANRDGKDYISFIHPEKYPMKW